MDPVEKKIGLSIKAALDEPEDSSLSRVPATSQQGDGSATLGDLVGGDMLRRAGGRRRRGRATDELRRRGQRTTMTKADLVEEVIRVADLSKKDAEIVVNTVFEQIVDALQRDDKIELRGFGSFRVRRRRSRQGRNPKTGDRVDVPSKRIPYFKPGQGAART